MVLSEEELQRVYEYCKKADFSQLVALSGLFQQFLENATKEEQESLALMLNKYEEKNKTFGAKVK